MFVRRRCFSVLLGLGVCLVLAVAARAQGNNIRGKLRDSSGKVMAQVVVEIQTGNGQPFSQTVTSNEGDFYFYGLGETTYVLTVSLPDYQPVSVTVNFVNRVGADRPGETQTIDVTMTPKNAARSLPARPAFAQDVPKAARDAFERGMKFSREGKSADALAAMQEAVKLFPQYFDAHFALGNELMKAGKLSEAISELEQARQINAKDDRVYQSFGMVLSQQKNYLMAAAVFAEAARLSPRDANIRLMRATALIDHASTLDPKSAKSASDRTNLLNEAERDLTQAAELSGKKLSAVHLQAARLYEKRGENARAASELEAYLKEVPTTQNAAAIREAIKKLRAGKP